MPGWNPPDGRGSRRGLHDLDFPGTRQQIVGHAPDTRAGHEVMLLIRELPVETYPDVAAVCNTVAGPPPR
jgi:hypothetical protein